MLETKYMYITPHSKHLKYSFHGKLSKPERTSHTSVPDSNHFVRIGRSYQTVDHTAMDAVKHL